MSEGPGLAMSAISWLFPGFCVFRESGFSQVGEIHEIEYHIASRKDCSVRHHVQKEVSYFMQFPLAKESTSPHDLIPGSTRLARH